jgi:hypothetical protein
MLSLGAVGIPCLQAREDVNAALAWGWNRRPRATRTDRESKRMGLRELIPLFIGMACISLEGILGGLPALAHHLTSRPGKAWVTVMAKETSVVPRGLEQDRIHRARRGGRVAARAQLPVASCSSA